MECTHKAGAEFRVGRKSTTKNKNTTSMLHSPAWRSQWCLPLMDSMVDSVVDSGVDFGRTSEVSFYHKFTGTNKHKMQHKFTPEPISKSTPESTMGFTVDMLLFYLSILQKSTTERTPQSIII